MSENLGALSLYMSTRWSADDVPASARSSFPPRAPLTLPRQAYEAMDVKESEQPLLPVYSSNGTGTPKRFADSGGTSCLPAVLSRQKRVVVLVLVAVILTGSYWRQGSTLSLPTPAIAEYTGYSRAKLGGEPLPPKYTPPPKTAWELPKMEDAGLPVMDDSQFVQPRRKVRPSWPNPWDDLDDVGVGAAWRVDPYSTLKKMTDDQGKPLGLQDPPSLHPPPARYLSKAYEWASKNVRSAVRHHPTTGRPMLVNQADLYVDPDWTPPDLDLDSLSKARNGLPSVQTRDWPNEGVKVQRQRQLWVKRAFLHAWEGYKRHAWGHDEARPMTRSYSDNYNGWGATIVDNLDTLLMMGLSHEYSLARKHVEQIDFSYLTPNGAGLFSTDLPSMSDFEPEEEADEDDDEDLRKRGKRAILYNGHAWNSPQTISWFETLIRYLGGMLSAFELSQDPIMLQRATELGDWLLPAMSTRWGLPTNRYMMGNNPKGASNGRVVLAEAGTMTLELTKLSMLTGDLKYFHAAQRAMDTFDTRFTKVPIKEPGSPTAWRTRLGALLPAWIDGARPDVGSGDYVFGGLADSYYEYLIKQHQLLKGKAKQYERMYKDVIDSVYTYLYHRIEVVPGRDDLATIGSVRYGNRVSELEHLTCFAGGMFGLGARLLDRPDDMDAATNVTNACAWMYESTATGCGPESLQFYKPDDTSRYVIVDSADGPGKVRKPRGSPVIGVKTSTPRYIGRPESIESVFYMYRLTGDRAWQDQGWKMFTSWVESAITATGFATVNNVHNVATSLGDSQESFVLAETLKYYWLLFADPDVISLDEYVFNTEAHPLRIPTDKEPTVLWTGPDTDGDDDAASFSGQSGEGTPVQQWYRVQQAAALSRLTKSTPKKKVPRPAFNELGNEVPNRPVGMGGQRVH